MDDIALYQLFALRGAARVDRRSSLAGCADRRRQPALALGQHACSAPRTSDDRMWPRRSAGIACPPTTLEAWLRGLAHEPTYGGSCTEHRLQRLFHDLPGWMFTVAYTLFDW
jgi:hypothetical protein